MSAMHIYYAALFCKEPNLGDINPEGEIYYTGYARVPCHVLDGKNISKIVFPPSDQDEPVFVSHVVVLDKSGKVVGVKAIYRVDN